MRKVFALAPASCLLVLTSFLSLTSKSDEKCAGSTRAIDICTLVSNPAEYDGKELVIRGLYRMVIHGSIMTGPACKKVDVNMRRAYDWKGDKHAQAVLRTLMKKNQDQFVELVIRGTLHVAKEGQCFGQNCLSYEVEERELFCAAPPDERQN